MKGCIPSYVHKYVCVFVLDSWYVEIINKNDLLLWKALCFPPFLLLLHDFTQQGYVFLGYPICAESSSASLPILCLFLLWFHSIYQSGIRSTVNWLFVWRKNAGCWFVKNAKKKLIKENTDSCGVIRWLQ